MLNLFSCLAIYLHFNSYASILLNIYQLIWSKSSICHLAIGIAQHFGIMHIPALYIAFPSTILAASQLNAIFAEHSLVDELALRNAIARANAPSILAPLATTESSPLDKHEPEPAFSTIKTSLPRQSLFIIIEKNYTRITSCFFDTFSLKFPDIQGTGQYAGT